MLWHSIILQCLTYTQSYVILSFVTLNHLSTVILLWASCLARKVTCSWSSSRGRANTIRACIPATCGTCLEGWLPNSATYKSLKSKTDHKEDIASRLAKVAPVESRHDVPGASLQHSRDVIAHIKFDCSWACRCPDLQSVVFKSLNF